MVYVKKVYDDGTEIRVPIDEYGTVFINCPFCGKEQAIGLSELIKDDIDFDFGATQVLCVECSNVYMNYRNNQKED